MTRLRALCVLFVIMFAAAGPAAAQTAPPLPQPKPMDFERTPAPVLFDNAEKAADMPPRAIGYYNKGCLAGAAELPKDGPAWQAMRLSRDRNWGHPELVDLVKRLALEAKAEDGWPGLLVGDLSMPRGGPMPYGHASHQVGLDADIWLTPMPERTLTAEEREEMSAVSVVKDRHAIDPKVWTEAHARLIKRAASYRQVERIFVHPPIKKQLCQWAKGDRSWLAKVRAYWGHHYHFHIRIKCPEGSTNCRDQAPPRPADGTGCGDELAYWMSDAPWAPPDEPPAEVKPPPPMMLSALPKQCRAVIAAD